MGQAPAPSLQCHSSWCTRPHAHHVSCDALATASTRTLLTSLRCMTISATWRMMLYMATCWLHLQQDAPRTASRHLHIPSRMSDVQPALTSAPLTMLHLRYGTVDHGYKLGSPAAARPAADYSLRRSVSKDAPAAAARPASGGKAPSGSFMAPDVGGAGAAPKRPSPAAAKRDPLRSSTSSLKGEQPCRHAAVGSHVRPARTEPAQVHCSE